VVNRSQKDIDGKKDIKAALAAERKFSSVIQTHGRQDGNPLPAEGAQPAAHQSHQV